MNMHRGIGLLSVVSALGVALLLIGTSSAAADANAPAAPAPWALGQDFSAHSGENPTPSHGGAAWYYLQSGSLAHNGKYTRLGHYDPAFLGLKGYGQWTGSALADEPSSLSPAGYPYIGVNGSGRNADPPAEYSTPPGAVIVHPNGTGAGNGPPALAVIGWKSPLTVASAPWPASPEWTRLAGQRQALPGASTRERRSSVTAASFTGARQDR